MNASIRRHARRAGFTLIELMISAAIVGSLATVAIPGYMRFQHAARMGEAKTNLAAIRTAEEGYRTQFGTYVAAAAAPPGLPTNQQRAWVPTPGFDTLGWVPEGSVYFDYSVVCTGAACASSFTSEAIGDTDGDTTVSAFGYVHAAPGIPVGLPGTFCAATGVFNAATAGADLMNTVGPCRATDGNSVF